MDTIFVSRCLTSHILKLEGVRLLKCFIDLKKAYDNVDRQLLWEMLKVIGFPPKVIELIRAMYDGARATVFVNGKSAEPFITTNGLKQGPVLYPIFFNIFRYNHPGCSERTEGPRS